MKVKVIGSDPDVVDVVDVDATLLTKRQQDTLDLYADRCAHRAAPWDSYTLPARGLRFWDLHKQHLCCPNDPAFPPLPEATPQAVAQRLTAIADASDEARLRLAELEREQEAGNQWNQAVAAAAAEVAQAEEQKRIAANNEWVRDWLETPEAQAAALADGATSEAEAVGRVANALSGHLPIDGDTHHSLFFRRNETSRLMRERLHQEALQDRIAAAQRLRVQLDAWVAEHGSANQKERFAAGLLLNDEVEAAIRCAAVDNLNRAAGLPLPPYGILKLVGAGDRCRICRADCYYDRYSVGGWSHAAWEYNKCLMPVLPQGATIAVRGQRSKCPTCASVIRDVDLLTVTWTVGEIPIMAHVRLDRRAA